MKAWVGKALTGEHGLRALIAAMMSKNTCDGRCRPAAE